MRWPEPGFALSPPGSIKDERFEIPGLPPPARREGDYRPQLDALRAFAVLAVLVTHFWQPSYRGAFQDLDLGFLGVRLFFTLSGFLITRILLGCREEHARHGHPRLGLVRQFYIRRFLRIFPLSYLIIAGALVVDVPDLGHGRCSGNLMAVLRGSDQRAQAPLSVRAATAARIALPHGWRPRRFERGHGSYPAV